MVIAAQGDEDTDEESEDEQEIAKAASKGLTLPFDVVRRCAQPLGIDLPAWAGRIIEVKKGVVRLLPVRERSKQLFGEEGIGSIASEIESGGREAAQMVLFPDAEARAPKVRGRKAKGVDVKPESMPSRREATTLDRVHAAMLLQAGGQSHALRALLKDEVQCGPDFLRLANALTALYPRASEEKRLLDAMLLAVRR